MKSTEPGHNVVDLQAYRELTRVYRELKRFVSEYRFVPNEFWTDVHTARDLGYEIPEGTGTICTLLRAENTGEFVVVNVKQREQDLSFWKITFETESEET